MRRSLIPEESEILESISKAEKSDTFLSRVMQRDVVPEGVLRLKDINSLGGMRYIAPLLFHSKQKVRELALQRVHELFLQADDNDLNWLDESMRGGYLYRYELDALKKWSSLSVDMISGLNCSGGELVSALSVLSCHRNGYIREAALRRLVDVDMFTATRMLLIRVNDWVRSIRNLAVTTLTENIGVLDESLITRFLVLVDQLRKRSRHDHTQLISIVEERLSSVSGQTALIKAVADTDFRMARSAFQLSRKVMADKEKVLEFGARHTDPLIRSWSLNLALEYLNGDQLIEYLLDSSGDQLGALRKRSIYKLIDLDYQLARQPLIDCLCAPGATMRNFARFYLNREEGFDCADFYRKQLLEIDNNLLAGAILGLSETGAEEDWGKVLAYEHHNLPKVRAAVVAASARLAKEQCDWLLAKVVNGCPAEIKAAKHALILLDGVDIMELHDIHKANFRGLQGRVLRQLIVKKDYWLAAELILQAIVDGDGEGKDEFDMELGSWLGRYGRMYWFVKPDTKVLPNIVNLSRVIESKYDGSVNVSSLRKMVKRLLTDGS
ncbi:hypothetical protein A9Q81_23920 [Gammaproteobacteria bacterium 42_54_T18]|mgnify:CR=1 FL=1|nr:hypothetical protein A9Q81_23920 [Gammaproteobacteria bacterium 42_54_T18]